MAQRQARPLGPALRLLAALPTPTLALVAAVVCPSVVGATASAAPDPLVARGRYLIVIGGCNECHTPGYVEAGGKLAEADWLTGTDIGWQGPWGTTYPANLRRFIAALSEDEWVQYTRHVVTRPPMGWFVLNALSESDARAIYRFVHGLGVAGEPAPPYAMPGVEVGTPVIRFPGAPAE